MEYGNLAYKLPEQYDEPIKKRKPQKRKEKTVNTTAVSNKRNHEQMQYKRTIFRGICVTVLLAVSAGFMISTSSNVVSTGFILRFSQINSAIRFDHFSSP